MTTELTQEQLSKIEQEEQDKLDKLSHELNQTLKIAVIGKVSAGKSSLLNAFFNRTRENPLAHVGAVLVLPPKSKSFH